MMQNEIQAAKSDIDKHKQARVSCLTRACGMTVPTEMRRDVRPSWGRFASCRLSPGMMSR